MQRPLCCRKPAICASDISGGYDGLPGLTFKPLLGVFDYDLYGHTYYLYALAALAVVFYFVRRVVYSPFGQALTGIRENVRRMHAIGSPVHWRLVTVYTIAAAIAGVAGALFTQTNAYVTLTVFDFDNSAKVMVMLILGGQVVSMALSSARRSTWYSRITFRN